MWCDQPFSQKNMTIGRTMKVEFRGDSKVGGEGGGGGGGGQNLENFVGNMGVDNMEGWGRARHKIGC